MQFPSKAFRRPKCHSIDAFGKEVQRVIFHLVSLEHATRALLADAANINEDRIVIIVENNI